MPFGHIVKAKRIIVTTLLVGLCAIASGMLAIGFWVFVLDCSNNEDRILKTSDLRPLVLECYNPSRHSTREEIEQLLRDRILGEIAIGSDEGEVKTHIYKHFDIESISPEKDWYDQNKWQYRISAFTEGSCVGQTSLSFTYTFEHDKLTDVRPSVSASYL